MHNTYKVGVDKAFEFDLTDQDILEINSIKNSGNSYHILYDNKSYHAEVAQTDFTSKKYSIKVNNTTYKVSIANDLDLRIAAMGFSVGSSKQINTIKAPMPGLLLDIQVKVGQEVNEDDPLLILEAMKMENLILSPRNGVIKSISATKGDAVDKGQLLIEFE